VLSKHKIPQSLSRLAIARLKSVDAIRHFKAMSIIKKTLLANLLYHEDLKHLRPQYLLCKVLRFSKSIVSSHPITQ